MHKTPVCSIYNHSASVVHFHVILARESGEKGRKKRGKRKEKGRKKGRKEGQNVKNFSPQLPAAFGAAQTPRGYRSDAAGAFGPLKPRRLSPSC